MVRHIVFLNGRDAGTSLDLPDKGTVRFGRSRTNQVTIRDRNVSRVHCQLVLTGDEATLTDLNSANGTLVNGERIGQRRLQDRDMLTIGFTRLRFEHIAADNTAEAKPRVIGRLLCIQCGAEISEEDVHAGVAQQIGSVFYCAECSHRMTETELMEDTTTVTTFKDKYVEGDFVGPYKLIQRVGYGYRGHYWLVDDNDNNQKIALKLYDSDGFPDIDWGLQYMREIKRTVRFSHPHIVHVVDAGLFGNRFAVAMEFVKGRSLQDIFVAQRRVTPSAAVRIAADLLRALSYLEKHHYSHGDVQPSAVMVIRTGLAKLGDFGLRFTLPALGPGARFKASRGIDSMRYYPPEQFDADAVLDHRADLYGVGALLYHLICRRPPFGGSTAKEVVTNIRTVMPIPPSLISSGLPAALNSVLAHAMGKGHEERYQTAAEFLGDLEAILDVPKS